MTRHNLKQIVCTFLLLIGMMPTAALAADAFRDIKLDLMNGHLLTAEEISGKTTLSFGIAVAEDGTISRVGADDTNANAVINGKYHSDQHGLQNFSATVAVAGPVKITFGGCNWGGMVTVKDASGTEVVKSFTTNIGACYAGNPNEKTAIAYYGGEATTLTISGGAYVPYFAVEAVSASDIPNDVKISFSLGENIAEGTVPAAQTVETGKAFTIPANRTLYAAGKTLAGWTDGSTTYKSGESLNANSDITLTAVFTDNTVTLADRTEATTLLWDFQRKNGAPIMAYQGGGATGIYVTQATVAGQSIDVKLDFDATSGKIANANWNDWCQMNNGTKFSIPSCKDAVISIEAYSAPTTTTIDGQTDYTASGNVISYTIANTAETIDIVIGDGSYYRTIQIILPVIEQSSGKTYTNEAAAIVWDFNDSNTYSNVSSVVPAEAFSMTSVNTGDLTIKGVGTGQAVDAEGNKIVFVKLNPAGTTTAAEWAVKPAQGVTFTPTKVSAYIQRFGTDAENGVTVTAQLADGTQEVLGNFTAPRNNKVQADDKFGGSSNYTNQFVISLTEAQQAKLTSSEGFSLFCTVGVSNTKEGGFSNVRIEGILNGTMANVSKHTLSVKASPEEGGTINVYPANSEYEQGTELTLTATKNFGYQFVNWTDATGAEVSTEAKFKYTLETDAELTANFVKVNTYIVDVTVERPANDYMVQWNPAPTVVDGKNMYEEGTTLTLTASNNKILTFAGWSNGETAGEISFNITEDIILTANYSAIDFIAGWDFYKRGSDGRIADFAAADNDADQFILRDASGKTSGWLDKSQEAAGGYEGKPAAVNWRNDAAIGTYYYQTKVNAEAFTDLKAYAEMLYNYNAYQKQDVEYSLDGENWTLIGSIVMEGVKNWTVGEFSLPAEANNQKEVYIRWKADTSSTLDGTTSANDGTCITNVFIIGTAKLIDDGKAPALTATIPAEGASNASANGKIVLTFDEKVKAAEGTQAELTALATGEITKLSPAVSGKTVIFEYKGLSYATDYIFKLPGNTISDLTGNAITEAITIGFTTKNKPVVTKAMYDFIVPDDGDFKAALAAAAKRVDTSKRYRIFIKKGDYTIPADENATVTGTDGKPYPSATTTLNTPNVSIIGEDMEGTSLVNTVPTELIASQYGPQNPLEGIGRGDVLQLKGGATNTYFQDITIKSGMADATGRNIVLNDQSNKTICKDVCLWAYQDTYVSNSDKGRFYFEGGTLRGRTDFLCGKGDVYYNAVNLQMCASGYLAVPSKPKQYGYIFKDCTIKGEVSGLDGNYTLGRPWGSGTPIALFIDTKMEIQPSAGGWADMSGGWPNRFAEYNSTTISGTAIDLSSRRTSWVDNDGISHANNPVLTAEEAAQMSIARVMGADDDWDPTEATEQASAPENVVQDGFKLTWNNSNYALCWAVVKNGKVIAFTTEPTYTVDEENAVYAVRAANEMGGLGDASVASVASAIRNTAPAAKVVKTSYYNLQGVEVGKAFKGTVIKVEIFDNGEKTTVKTVK